MPVGSQTWKLIAAALALVGCRLLLAWDSVLAGCAALLILVSLAASIIAKMPRVRRLFLIAAMPMALFSNAVVFALGAFVVFLGSQGLLADGRIGDGPRWNWAFALVPAAALANLIWLAWPKAVSRWLRWIWLANLSSAIYAIWSWWAERDLAGIMPVETVLLIGLTTISLTMLTWEAHASMSPGSAGPRRLARFAMVSTCAVLISTALWLAVFPAYHKRKVARDLEQFGFWANFGVIAPRWYLPNGISYDWYRYLGEIDGASAPDAIKGDVNDAGRLLNSLPWLSSLVVNDVPPGSERLLEPLVAKTKLRQVALMGPGVTDETLADAARLPALTRAYFQRAQITDDGLANLAGAQWLQALLIRQTPIAGDGLIHLTSLPRLAELDLSGTNVGDQQIAVIPRFNALKSLSLLDTQVTDDVLTALAQCKKLKTVHLSGSRVTAGGVERLQRALPNCEVMWNQSREGE